MWLSGNLYYVQRTYIEILGWFPVGSVSLTSRREGASLALVGHPSFGVDVLQHQLVLHPIVC